VIGNVNVIKGDNGDDSEVTSDGYMKQMRLEGSGANDDETFGGWIRLGDGDKPEFNAYSWWKPIDQLRVIIGGNPDGHWTKEGVAGWGFYQTANDSGIVEAGNTWGGSAGGYWMPGPASYLDPTDPDYDPSDGEWFGGDAIYGVYRNAFFGGVGYRALMLEITPADMVAINIALPVFTHAGEKTADVFQSAVVQVDLKFDFGNIAISYVGGIVRKPKYKDDGVTIAEKGISNPGKLFAYFGGSFGAISLDVGLGYHFAGGELIEDPTDPTSEIWVTTGANPIWIGAGVKYSADSFGVKGRLLAGVGGDDKAIHLRGEAMPFFVINDNMRAYVPFGLGMLSATGWSSLDWHFTPYIEIGQEWGSKFLAGVKVDTSNNGDTINWAVPISIMVSF